VTIEFSGDLAVDTGPAEEIHESAEESHVDLQLFAAKSLHWIDTRGASSGDQAGTKRGKCNDNGDDDKDNRIAGTHASKQACYEVSENKCERETEEDAGACEP
jgi:hypothetical protein